MGRRRSKPCSECGRWFVPDPRIGKRARTCTEEACQRRRRARTNQRWRAANAGYDHARRLAAKVAAAAEREEVAAPSAPLRMARIGWEVVQAEIGLKPTVIIQDLVRLVLLGAQAEMRLQGSDIHKKFGRILLLDQQAESDLSVADHYRPP